MDDWIPFFSATAGAGGVLAGLIFVSLSVNIRQIIEGNSLSSRAAGTIGSLILAVVVSLAILIPRQPAWLLGVEVLLAAAGAFVLHGFEAARLIKAPNPVGGPLPKIALGIGPVIPFAVGGVLIAVGSDAGLGWVAGGVLLVVVASVVNAWVLLVEILR